MIDTALISAPARGSNLVFGRPLLERLMLICERAGVKRFFIAAPPGAAGGIEGALGRFRDHPGVTMVDSFDRAAEHGLGPEAQCVAFTGNLVFGAAQLRQMLERHALAPEKLTRMVSADHDRSGAVAIGPAAAVLSGLNNPNARAITAGYLPFALNGRPEDRDEAELRLARSLREETVHTDAVMARVFDRHLSWRISSRLARTGITPNQVTLANTALGIVSAILFATPGYWLRLLGALLFVVSVTLDGVDGELARLTMTESEAGGRLDRLTDNVVHVAVFIGLMTGCYRASGSAAYLYLTVILLAGFGLCAFSVNRALSVTGDRAQEFVGKVERVTGRDFAYLLLLLALIGWLPVFCWGTAIGTYIFAAGMWLVTNRWLARPAA